MDFGSSSRNQQGPSASQIMDQVKTELATAYFQELFQTVRDTCFNKCITRPGTSMSKSEVTCMANCCDRYIEATKVVAQTVLSTAKSQESESLGGGLH